MSFIKRLIIWQGNHDIWTNRVYLEGIWYLVTVTLYLYMNIIIIITQYHRSSWNLSRQWDFGPSIPGWNGDSVPPWDIKDCHHETWGLSSWGIGSCAWWGNSEDAMALHKPLFKQLGFLGDCSLEWASGEIKLLRIKQWMCSGNMWECEHNGM